MKHFENKIAGESWDYVSKLLKMLGLKHNYVLYKYRPTQCLLMGDKGETNEVMPMPSKCYDYKSQFSKADFRDWWIQFD